MSVVRCEVVKCFTTRCTDKGMLCYSFFVLLEMTIETRLLSETLIATRALIRFLSSMNVLMSFEAVQAGECFTTAVAPMLFTCLSSRWLAITSLNSQQ